MNRSICSMSLVLILAVTWFSKAYAGECVPPGATIAEVRALSGLPGSGEVASFAFLDGVPVVVVDGIAWEQVPDTCEWVYLLELYQPSFFTDTFFNINEDWYRWLDSGVPVRLSTEFSDDFEVGSSVVDLILHNLSRYTSFVLLSPMAPTIPEYNALRDCILDGTCDFLDNRIDFAPQEGHKGNQSLRFYSVAPSPEMITAKCLVEREMYFFRKGDTVNYSAWYKAQVGLPFTIVDFNTGGILNRPGLRITIGDGALGAELKWLDKPQYLQKPGSEILFPLDQWVHVRVQILFSEDEFGKIEIWQDNVKVVNQYGRTLPTNDSVIDFVIIGITATQQESVLYVDDVKVSKIPVSPKPSHRKVP